MIGALELLLIAHRVFSMLPCLEPPTLLCVTVTYSYEWLWFSSHHSNFPQQPLPNVPGLWQSLCGVQIKLAFTFHFLGRAGGIYLFGIWFISFKMRSSSLINSDTNEKTAFCLWTNTILVCMSVWECIMFSLPIHLRTDIFIDLIFRLL